MNDLSNNYSVGPASCASPMLSAAVLCETVCTKFARITGNTERHDSASPSLKDNARKAHQAK